MRLKDRKGNKNEAGLINQQLSEPKQDNSSEVYRSLEPALSEIFAAIPGVIYFPPAVPSASTPNNEYKHAPMERSPSASDSSTLPDLSFMHPPPSVNATSSCIGPSFYQEINPYVVNPTISFFNNIPSLSESREKISDLARLIDAGLFGRTSSLGNRWILDLASESSDSNWWVQDMTSTDSNISASVTADAQNLNLNAATNSFTFKSNTKEIPSNNVEYQNISLCGNSIRASNSCNEKFNDRQKFEEIWAHSEALMLEFLRRILVQSTSIPEICITRVQFDFIVAFCADEIVYLLNSR